MFSHGILGQLSRRRQRSTIAVFGLGHDFSDSPADASEPHFSAVGNFVRPYFACSQFPFSAGKSHTAGIGQEIRRPPDFLFFQQFEFGPSS